MINISVLSAQFGHLEKSINFIVWGAPPPTHPFSRPSASRPLWLWPPGSEPGPRLANNLNKHYKVRMFPICTFFRFYSKIYRRFWNRISGRAAWLVSGSRNTDHRMAFQAKDSVPKLSMFFGISSRMWEVLQPDRAFRRPSGWRSSKSWILFQNFQNILESNPGPGR